MGIHHWFEKGARQWVLGLTIVLGWGGGTDVMAAIGEVSKVAGFVMDVDEKTATLEVERKTGDFVTLHLDRAARWILSKVEVGDLIKATVTDQGDRLVVKEISFQVGPAVQIDILQGIVTKTKPREHTIEVKTSVGTVETLYLDESTLRSLSRLAPGDEIEARVETVIEEGGAKKVIRTILIGKGP